MTKLRAGRLAAPLLTALTGVTAAYADPPQITNITPAGVTRGVATEVTIQGARLAANPRLISELQATVEPSAEPAGDPAAAWKMRLTVPAETPLGVYPVRVATDEGLSNPFLLAVGQLPNVAETEPNNLPDQATPVAMPAVVEAACAGNDVDFFRFSGVKGQTVLIDAQCARIASGVDPQLRLTTRAGRLVASADDSAGFGTDARLLVELPEDGDYLVEFSDTKYAAGGRANYRLTIGSIPVAGEIYPLGGRRGETVGFELRGGTIPADRCAVGAATLAVFAPTTTFRPRLTSHMLGLAGPTDPVYDLELPTTLDVSDLPEVREPADESAAPPRAAVPVVFNGRIEKSGDTDRFHILATPGQVLRVRVHAADLGSALDASIQVLNAANDQTIASGDDITAPPTGLPGQPRKAPGATSIDPTLDVTVPGGVTELALVIRDLTGAGGVGYPYRIVVEPVVPTVQLLLAGDPQVSLPRSGAVNIPLTVVRAGYNGPLTVTVPDPPPGLRVRPAEVGEGHPVGLLGLSATADAAFEPTVLNLVATAQGPAGPIAVRAEKVVVYAQQNNLPSTFAVQSGLAAALAPPPIVRLETPAEPIEAVHGYSVTVPVTVDRSAGEPAQGELTVQPFPLPPGFAIAETKIAADAADGTITVNLDPGAALGQTTLGLLAKGKFQDRNQTFAIPPFTLKVVRPIRVELAAASLEVKPGQTAELAGKLIRHGPFREPVTLSLNGLPAGLKAEPVTVAPETGDFVLKVEAATDAPAAEAAVQLAPAPFKVADKDYTAPPTPLTIKVVP
ncbi:MAG: hypothetical protein KatS3mg108_2167 [Isosphaeraceae bacterium]|jgi:hypothetical protein|nr:MAG: hypothetical protein KatS3mg108_2167 [Isosphaeraceae bacterium]